MSDEVMEPQPKYRAISPEEYLEGEKVSDIKHEFVNGEVFAMAGASKNHGRISANLARRLGNHLEGSSCEPYVSDVKVKTATGSYRYPDVLVVCDDQFSDDDYVTDAPLIIVEVLSRSTRRTDEIDKFLEYINIPSLKEYVVIEQDFVKVTVYRANDDWRCKHYFLDDEVPLESIELELPVEDIYQRVQNLDMEEWLEAKAREEAEKEEAEGKEEQE
jgi:Uma2 family endonuclease